MNGLANVNKTHIYFLENNYICVKEFIEFGWFVTHKNILI